MFVARARARVCVVCECVFVCVVVGSGGEGAFKASSNQISQGDSIDSTSKSSTSFVIRHNVNLRGGGVGGWGGGG